MQLKSNGGDTKRDLFPKLSLHSGHLGDGFPLCADLPSRPFLREGSDRKAASSDTLGCSKSFTFSLALFEFICDSFSKIFLLCSSYDVS